MKLKILIGLLTIALFLVVAPTIELEASTTKTYKISSTSVSTLTTTLEDIATVSRNGNTITITLTSDVGGCLEFDVADSNVTFFLNASNHIVDAGGLPNCILIKGYNEAKIVLTGNGTYQGAEEYTIFGERFQRIYIESGTFKDPANTKGDLIETWHVNFILENGYDYYTVKIGDSFDYFGSFHDYYEYNRLEREVFSPNFGIGNGDLVVTQSKGIIPSYNIIAPNVDNGSYVVKVNGEVSNTAKPDDRIEIEYTPDPNYKIDDAWFTYTGLGIKKNRSKYFEYEDEVYMPQSDITMVVSFAWIYKITRQPTVENPTVITNNPDGIKSYQWYRKYMADFSVVDAYTYYTYPDDDIYNIDDFGHISRSAYDSTTKTWSPSDDDLKINLTIYNLNKNEYITIIPVTGEIISVSSGVLREDGSYTCLSNTDITFSDNTGKCRIMITRNREEQVKGQNTATYTGPAGEVYCFIMTDGYEFLYSDSILVKPHICSENTLTEHGKMDASCTETGLDSYYECTCGKLYSDLAGSTEITKVPVIPAKGHYYGTDNICDICGHSDTKDVAPPKEKGKILDGTPANSSNSGKLVDVDDVADKSLTEEQKARVENGEDVKITLEVKDISDSISEDDKGLIMNMLDEYTVGLYLDINLYAQIGSDSRQQINKTNGKIKITIKVPDSLVSTKSNVTRTYKIIRVHEGVVTLIDAIYDPAKRTLTFETDRFSTYGLVYNDVTITTPDTDDSKSKDEKEEVPKTDNSTSKDEKDEVPKTGDSNEFYRWYIILLGSISMILYISIKKKIVEK